MARFENNEILILGNGQLGTKMMEKLPGARNLSLPEIDFLNLKHLERKLLEQEGVKVLINTVAWVNAESAEERNNYETVRTINSIAILYLTEVCRKKGWILVHISSDYVFDGTIKNISETDTPNPLSVYGETKLVGDRIALSCSEPYVIRTSWVVGDSMPSDNFRNFAKTMVKLITTRSVITVVNDQFGRLTFSSTLADGIISLIENDSEKGIYNISNDGKIRSWYQIACLIKEMLTKHIDIPLADIKPITTSDWVEIQASEDNIVAPRPKNSDFNLNKIKSSGFIPEDYEHLLEDYVVKLIKENGLTASH